MVGLLDGTEAVPSKTVPTELPDKTRGTAPNPAYDAWLVRDQQVLSYLLNSISPEILSHVLRYEHAAGVWTAVEEMFASQSRAKVTNLRIALTSTKKIGMTTPAFFSKMQTIADELAAAGKPVDDEELLSFILVGLGPAYEDLVGAIGLMKTPISINELYSQVLAKDQRQDLNGTSHDGGFESSANSATRSRQGGGYRSRGGGNKPAWRGERQGDRPQQSRQTDDRWQPRPNNRGAGRAGPAGGGRGRGRGRRRTSPWVDVTCQICNREGHAAKDCWHRFHDNDDDDMSEEKDAHAYGVDTN